MIIHNNNQNYNKVKFNPITTHKQFQTAIHKKAPHRWKTSKNKLSKTNLKFLSSIGLKVRQHQLN